MPSKRYAKSRAKRKSRQVFRSNRKRSKLSVLRKFANFVGKATYKRSKSYSGLKRKKKRYGMKYKKTYKKKRYY